MTITLFGIPNCDQVKKARTWLETEQIPYVFHDFKKAGINRALIEGWLQYLPWDSLINRKGSTWRKLDDARRAEITNPASAIALMLEQPSIIKRPVLQLPLGHPKPTVPVVTGFDANHYQALFSA
jgi:arsenate reductase (glutaredoxin)